MDLLNRVDALKRPRLLINAARIGSSDYRRELHLRRHLGADPFAKIPTALKKLIELEDNLNAARLQRSAEYSVSRHVDLLIAIMGEARLLRASHAGTPPETPGSKIN